MREPRFEIDIDRSRSAPVYRQIVERIMQMVKDGKLAPGDKLPSARTLAAQLGLARGTVTKAYECLAGYQVVSFNRGSGTFVSASQHVLSESRKEQAVSLIKDLIVELEKLRFSHREMDILFHLMLMSREDQRTNFIIAAVDCNPEALSVFEEQLRHLSRIQVVKYLLADVLASDSWSERLAAYDLILVTTTHYRDLVNRHPALAGKLVQAVVSPSQETVINLAGMPSHAKIVLVCRSREFMAIMQRNLRELRVSLDNVTGMFESGDLDLDSVLANRQILIVPPDSPLLSDKAQIEALGRFRARGGVIIQFTYQIERGSLITIEERIREALEIG